VLWETLYLSRADEEDIVAGTAVLACPHGVPKDALEQILIQAYSAGLPHRVCLTCAPGWLEMHHLALRDYRWQIAKEEAVMNQDFDRAVRVRQLQDHGREQIVALVAQLVDGSRAEPTAPTHPGT
jgi:hypothetical protein